MAAPTNTRRELLNVAFLAFIPLGETVDAIEVAVATWPDSDPVENYTAFEIPEVETLVIAREFEDDTPRKLPKSSGGYFEDIDTLLKRVTYSGKTAKTSSYFKQLENGLLSVPAVGVAQAPHVSNTNYIEGVTLLELQNKDGSVTERLQFWSRLRLDNPGETGPATRTLEFSLEVRESANNTYVLVA